MNRKEYPKMQNNILNFVVDTMMMLYNINLMEANN